MEKKKSVGDKVSIVATRYSNQIQLNGVIQQVRTRFGRTEYLIGELVGDPVWVRTVDSNGSSKSSHATA